MMSILYAIDLYDIPEKDIGIYIENFCNSTDTLKHNQQENCLSKYNSVYKYIFDNDFKTITSNNDSICFKNLIIGQEHVFSQASFELARGIFIRKFRNRVIERANLTHLLSSKSENHKIIVLTKDSSSVLFKSEALSKDLCNLVRKISSTVSPTPELICLSNLSALPFRKQLEYSLSATIVVTEHGTLSYFILFVRTGTVAIVLAPMEDDMGIKDPHIHLHMTHCQVFYLRPFDGKDGLDINFQNQLQGNLLHSLYIASNNFGIKIFMSCIPTEYSDNLRSMTDSRSFFPVKDGNLLYYFEFFFSDDRCTSTYRWCLERNYPIEDCEMIYLKVKKMMKGIDDKLLYEYDLA